MLMATTEPEMTRDHRHLSIVAGVALTAYALVGDRIYVPRGPSEGVLIGPSLLALLTIVVLVLRRDLAAAAFRRVCDVPAFLAFVTFGYALPVAGVIAGYPIHTVFAASVPLAIASAAVLGWLVVDDDRTKARIPDALLAIAWVQFTVGLMQALWYTHAMRTLPQWWLVLWDASVARDVGKELISGRSSGLLSNPNTYSLLGGILLVCAATLPLPRSQRLWLLAPSIGIVALGASRGVILTLALLALPAVFDVFRRMVPFQRLIAALALVVSALVTHVLLLITLKDVYSRVIARWATVPDVLTRGAAGDLNVIGRLEAWAKAARYLTGRPLGSFGPPQMAIESFTDNDLVAYAIQGGLVLLASYVAVLVTMHRSAEEGPFPATTRKLVLLVALTGLTQTTSILGPAIALFWPVQGTLWPGMGVATTAQNSSARWVQAVGVGVALFIVAALVMRVLGVSPI